MTPPSNLRVDSHPWLTFSRGQPVVLDYRGHKVKAYENESVGAALYASGVRVFSRSFKFHRPRGLFCVSGRCPNCMMTVNSNPNVRVCAYPVRDGMQVASQNAWPSAEHDFMGILDRLDFLFPAGFQYKRFIRPKFLWPHIEKIIRRTAGLGSIPERSADASSTEELSPDLVIVGGGPAGLSAAIQAGMTGAKTLLLTDSPRLGGRLRLQTSPSQGEGGFEGKRGFEVAERLAAKVAGLDNVSVVADCTVFGYYQEGLLAAEAPGRLLMMRPKRIVVATGFYDTPPFFVNNDMPGILLPGGLQRLMHDWGIKPGRTAVVGTRDDFGYELASNLVDIGVKSVTVVDERAQPAQRVPSGAELLKGWCVEEARGSGKLSAIKIRNHTGESRTINCDVFCGSFGTRPANELLFQLGCEMHYSEGAGGFLPVRGPDMKVRESCYAVGASAGTKTLPGAISEGKVAAESAVRSM